MMEFPEKIQEAISCFCKFPGVGEKTATRQVLAMANWRDIDILTYSEAVKALCNLQRCSYCGLFSEGDKCSVCLSPERSESGQICVVESITDAMAIERSGKYRGLFHVLGGVLNPLMGIGPDDLAIDRLLERIKNNSIKEVVLAINPSVEGDATSSYIRLEISNLPKAEEIIVERIGFGVPIGGSLEYLDPLTITKALENRRAL